MSKTISQRLEEFDTARVENEKKLAAANAKIAELESQIAAHKAAEDTRARAAVMNAIKVAHEKAAATQVATTTKPLFGLERVTAAMKAGKN
jgi:hypothetical protein